MHKIYTEVEMQNIIDKFAETIFELMMKAEKLGQTVEELQVKNEELRNTLNRFEWLFATC